MLLSIIDTHLTNKRQSLVDYPNKLNIIFDKLLSLNIKPIIVGGFVRDFILNKKSKDIDIELYGLSSLSELENILQEFGSINSVGKSFGVCKLKAFNLELDFSFPRLDSKIAQGHKGFLVKIDSSLDFKTASSRRDFTINAIGYDIEKRKILDPFNGINDLQNRTLKAVDSSKFAQDPLRVLRAIQFSTRFDLTLDKELFSLCRGMVKNKLLNELPRERIFEELKKLFLKSQNISKGVKLLKDLELFQFFLELQELKDIEFENITIALDNMYFLKVQNNNTNITLMLLIICYKLSPDSCRNFLYRLTNSKKILTDIFIFRECHRSFNLHNFNDYDLYKLAKTVKINDYLLFLSAINNDKNTHIQIKKLQNRAQLLRILTNAKKAIVTGKDLIKIGLEPSKEFSNILEKTYEAQIKGLFSTHKDAIKYIEERLLFF